MNKVTVLKIIVLQIIFLICAFYSYAATYYSQATGTFNTLSNWNTNRLGGGTSPTVFNVASDIFIVQGIGNGGTSPHTMTVTGASITFGSNGKLIIEDGGNMICTNSITMNATGTLQVDAGATFTWNNTGGFSNPFAGTEIFDANSTFEIKSSSTTGPTVLNFPGTFGNVIFNATNTLQCNDVFPDILGNLSIINTGEFRLAGSVAVAGSILNIEGNLNISNGILSFGNGSVAGTINLKGNFNMSGGVILQATLGGASGNNKICTFNFCKLGIQTFNKTGGAITAAVASFREIDFYVLNGTTLNLGTNILNSLISSNIGFVVNDGAKLIMGAPGGIVAQGTDAITGNIQTPFYCKRIFSKGANYEYNGTAAQITGNGLPDTVRSLTVNNAAGLTLSNTSLTDTAALYLTNGRIKTDATHSLILANTAKIFSAVNNYGDVNEGNQNSFINGPLQLETNTTNTITLPVGKDSATGVHFAPVKITPTNAVNKIYTVNYYPIPYNNLTVDANLHHVSQVENWQINCNVSPPDSYAKIGLSWRPMSKICVPTCTAADSADAWSDLAVAHYVDPGTGLVWLMDGVSPTFVMRTGSNLSYGYVTTNSSTGFYSPFTLASIGNKNILPLQLINFTANKVNNIIELQFTTKEEKDVLNYEVQKSNDGINFTTIKIVQAANQFAINYYNIFDNNFAINTMYYRLKINDITLKNLYSKVIKISTKKTATQVFPNPATTFITVKNVTLNNKKTFVILNTNGVAYKAVVQQSTNNCITFNISNLPNGYYFLKIVGNNKVENIPFLKL